MDEMIFVGDPAGLSDQEWNILAGAVVRDRDVTATFQVELPPLGEGNFDLRVTAMERILRRTLTGLLPGTVNVVRATATGGDHSRISYRITFTPESNG